MYCTTQEVWNWLNKSNKIRQEVLTTASDGIVRIYSLSNGSIISGSPTVKYGTSGYLSASTLTSSNYSTALDDGIITLTTSGSTAVSGSAVWVDYNYAPLQDSVVAQFISASDREIDRMTGRNFNSNSSQVDYISVSDDETEFFTSQYPVLSISTVEVNGSDVADPASWTTLSAGIGNDYLTNSEDLEMGRIRFIDNKPTAGTDNLRVTYNWGYASVPYEAKMSSIVLTAKNILDNPSYKASIVSGQNVYVNFSSARLLEEIERRLSSLKKVQFIRV